MSRLSRCIKYLVRFYLVNKDNKACIKIKTSFNLSGIPKKVIIKIYEDTDYLSNREDEYREEVVKDEA